MPVTITQVDSFTNKPFAGNPAGVCVLPDAREESWMQDVAREMNLAETAFLVRNADGYALRWFTPAAEVDLCGHATLASAHVLWETKQLPATETARFHTKSGLLTAVKRGDWIEMDFPATPDERIDAPSGLVESLGASPRYVGKTIFDYLVELDSEDSVRALRPDFRGLAALGMRGVIATARSADPAFEFVSRYFAPAFGIDEDPVTGSTHCALAPYWGRQLSKTSFLARQLSSRGGILKLELRGDRVGIAGQAVTVLRAELLA
jgi:PhzF family phenazine biosynthesis protein